jgi:drug/metabolite transporter (DMT)-like permease
LSTRAIQPAVVLALAVTILLWASSFVAVRAVQQGGNYSPVSLALIRYGIASLVLLAVARPFGVRLPARADVPRILASGFLGVALYNGLLNWGQTMMLAGAASFIVNTIPLFTALLSMFLLGDRLRPIGLLGMVASFIGITLIAIGEGKWLQLNVGAAVITIAAICWSTTTIIQKPLLQRYRAIEIVSYAIWSGTLMLALVGWKWLPGVESATVREHLLVLYLGIFPAALAYVCWAFVLSKLPASRASSFLYLVPPLATALEAIILRDRPSTLTLLGGSIALLGVIVTNTFGRAKAPAPQPR